MSCFWNTSDGLIWALTTTCPRMQAAPKRFVFCCCSFYSLIEPLCFVFPLNTHNSQLTSKVLSDVQRCSGKRRTPGVGWRKTDIGTDHQKLNISGFLRVDCSSIIAAASKYQSAQLMCSLYFSSVSERTLWNFVKIELLKRLCSCSEISAQLVIILQP